MVKAKRSRGSSSIPSWKKKRWFELIAPKMFKNQTLGETLVAEPDKMMKKPIKVSMMSLTGDMKKQHINIKFEVYNISENKAYTKVVGYEFGPASIKRLVRRRRKRVDDSYICNTKDNIKVRIKPFFVTRAETNKSVMTSMRKLSKTFIEKFAAERKCDDLIYDIIDYRLQRELRKVLAKIYPLRTCEIRNFSIVKQKKFGDEVVLPVEKVEKTEEKVETKPKKVSKKKEEVKEEKTETKEEAAKKEEAKPAKEEKVETKTEATPEVNEAIEEPAKVEEKAAE
jgi:small subunit ribosomal protein S3Ae